MVSARGIQAVLAVRRAPARLAFAAAMLMTVTGCAALVVSGAAGGAAQNEQRATDDRISSRVLAAFRADAMLRNHVVQVRTQAGVVTLSGSVPDYRVRSQAEALAAGVSGVTGVRNQIKVPGGG